MRASRLLRDNRATSTVEFALIAPALLLTLAGLFEYSHNIYTRTMLEGAIQKAARDSTIEGAVGRTETIDDNVTRAVSHIVPRANVTFDRKAYTSFTDVSRPEGFTDTNDDGDCNAGEPFEDANGNGTWDQDRGRTGQGSARDAVLYEVTVTYQSYFPVAEFIGLDANNVTKASTVLRNQPYDEHETVLALGNCA
jgi:Flp pilus assembly protein TadG